jgi:hypothetical protein
MRANFQKESPGFTVTRCSFSGLIGGRELAEEFERVTGAGATSGLGSKGEILARDGARFGTAFGTGKILGAVGGEGK